MYTLFALIFLLLGFLTAFITKIELFVVRSKIAKIALWLSLLVAVFGFISFFAGIKNTLAKDVVRSLFNWGKELVFFFVGLLSALLVRTIYKNNKISNDFIESKNEVLKLTLLAATIICVSFFFMVTIGKSRNAKEMEAFFVQSGYPASLNYVIMVMECIFSFGLLLHAKLKSGLVSSLILLSIMFGAVFTHVRNGDAIADSYDAFTQIMILGSIIILLFTERRFVHRADLRR